MHAPDRPMQSIEKHSGRSNDTALGGGECQAFPSLWVSVDGQTDGSPIDHSPRTTSPPKPGRQSKPTHTGGLSRPPGRATPQLTSLLNTPSHTSFTCHALNSS